MKKPVCRSRHHQASSIDHNKARCGFKASFLWLKKRCKLQKNEMKSAFSFSFSVSFDCVCVCMWLDGMGGKRKVEYFEIV